MYMLIILGNFIAFIQEKNIFLYTANQFYSQFNKKYNIYLYGPTYFSKDSKNQPSDDTWLRKHVVILQD